MGKLTPQLLSLSRRRASDSNTTPTANPPFSCSCGGVAGTYVSPSPERRTYDVRTVGQRRRRRVRKTLLLDYYTHATSRHTYVRHKYIRRTRTRFHGLRQPGTKEAPSTCFVDWRFCAMIRVSTYVACHNAFFYLFCSRKI